MKSVLKILSVFSLFFLMACHSEPSLQKYYVKHQNDDNFLVVDLPMSMIIKNLDELPEKSRKTLKSIQKANVLALPLNGNNHAQYKKQRKKVTDILQSGDYKLLMKMNFSGKNVQLRYLGNENAIDELVVLAYDDSKGFMVARILGKDMNPEAFLRLFEAAKSGKTHLDLKEMDQFEDFFDDKDKN